MKQFILTAPALFLILVTYSQANTKLSNLVSPTAVNQHLLPNSTNARDLGSSTYAWKSAYLRGYIYLDGTRFVSNAPGTGSYNAFVGSNAGYSITSGKYNTAIGHYALYKDTSGRYNVAAGAYALYSNTTGFDNMAIGPYTLYSNTIGGNNVAVGHKSLYANTEGNNNIAIGQESLMRNTRGDHNVAIGTYAMASNTTGFVNTAVGIEALISNTTGNNNVALGVHGLYSNTTGKYNTAVGSGALSLNSTSDNNTALGYDALYYTSTGTGNTAGGAGVLFNNQTGSYNTAFGQSALFYNKQSFNSAFGVSALGNTQAAQYNTAVGFQAGAAKNNGYNNVFIGAGTDVNGDGYYNVIALGQGTICTAPSQVTIGNPSTTQYRIYGSWINISDGRYKKNLKENVPGLDFINKLRPVTYTLDATSLDAFLNKGRSKEGQPSPEAHAIMDKVLKDKEAVVQTGFVAQEVEKAAKELNYNFSGVDAPKNSDDVYGLKYSEFVVPLVKAVQELDSTNKALQEELSDVKGRLSKLEALLSSNNNQVPSTSAYLEQNTPNPVNSSTTIRYYIPVSGTRARLDLTNTKGQLVKTLILHDQGAGQLNISTSTFATGTYNYTLYVNGKQVDTKRLVVIR